VTPAPTPPNDIAASVGPFPDLDVLAIEVTQGIQDLNNNMPLVVGRRTYVRVYLDVIGANELAHTYGALEARRDGQQIGWIWPENGPITATANGGNRLELNDSLYFRLPADWLHGNVKLTAFVYSHDVDFPWTREPSWQNNFEVETVTFHEAQPLDIHLVTLHLHRSFHPSDVVREYVPAIGGALDLANGNANNTARILAGLRRYHPISELTFDVFPIPIKPVAHVNGDEWDLGDCATTVVDGVGTVSLADWQPLMDEDTETDITVDASTVADNDTVWVMDRTIEVDHFYPREDGTADVFGTMTGTGPAPFAGAPAFVDGCPNPGDESGEPNTTVGAWRAWYDWADVREFFVGLVDETLPTRWGGLASSLDTAWVKMRSQTEPDWYLSGAGIMAHELGHLAGLQHVPCANNNDDDIPDELIGGPIDETHPQMDRFPECSLAEVREHGYYGFDVYYDLFGLTEPIVISNNPAAPNENVAFPLESYESPRWTDPYHYCLLLAYYGVPCDLNGLDEPFDPPTDADAFWQPSGHGDPPPDPGVPIAIATGSIDADGSDATLDGLMTFEEPTAALLEQLERQPFVQDEAVVAELVLLDETGEVLFEAPIADRSSVHGVVGRFGFKVLVPRLEGANRLEIVTPGGQAIEKLTLVHEGFEVQFVKPGGSGVSAIDDLAGACCTVEINGVDPATLTSSLLYSPDGEHWQVLGEATGTSVPLDPAVIETLPGSEEGRLRMVVTDGITTEIASDEPIVRVPNRAPVAWIDSPAVPMTFPLGRRITISGAAQDAEDRNVPQDAMTWSSSIDGRLGTGPEVITRGLSAGTHTITLEARDTAGAIGSASIELVVDGSTVEAPPPEALEIAVAGFLDAYGQGIDPSTVRELEPASDAGIPLPVLLSVGLVVLAVGGTSVWIRVSQTHGSAGYGSGRSFQILSAGDDPTAAPTAQPRGGFKDATGLATEHDVIESPPEEPPLGTT
jgi:hypothetical protein